MGRIKTKLIKRISFQLFKEHKDEFKPEFEENKALVSQHCEVQSKKLRNIIAGYITRMKKTQED